METEDPHAALSSKSVAERAAGCRDLARHGGWDDLPALVELGWGDKSMAVRLYAAAAASDIVHRRRGAHEQDSLSPDEAAQVVKWSFGGDPGTNPSMLMLAGAVESDAVLTRMARILRDPRVDVRLGAITALRRMVLSAASERSGVEGALEKAFADDKVPDDTRAELVRLVGEAGLPALRDRVVRVRARGGGASEVAEEALDRLDVRRRVEGWSGAWRSDGLDVYELALEPRDDRIAVSTDGRFYTSEGVLELELTDDGATLGGEPAVLVWARPLGAPGVVKALQVGGRTWWSVPADEAADFLEAHWRRLAEFDDAAVKGLRVQLEAADGAAAQRAAAIAAWLSGDGEGALELLEPMMKRKRPRTDLFWWRGRVLADLGRASEAKDDLQTYVDKAGKDAPFADEATALIASL